jgi:predicted O-methyltransferase YrrM
MDSTSALWSTGATVSPWEKLMNNRIQTLLAELEQFGERNDAVNAERPRRMLNITRDTGQFMGLLVRALAARRVLEIGTSNGYSTLWLAEAAQSIDGTVTTVESSEYKITLATENFERSELASAITLIHDDTSNILTHFQDGSFDLLFLDSDRSQYVRWWPDLRRLLRSRGLLVVDNAVSHAPEVASFIAMVESDESITTSLVPVGNGAFLAVKL